MEKPSTPKMRSQSEVSRPHSEISGSPSEEPFSDPYLSDCAGQYSLDHSYSLLDKSTDAAESDTNLADKSADDADSDSPLADEPVDDAESYSPSAKQQAVAIETLQGALTDSSVETAENLVLGMSEDVVYNANYYVELDGANCNASAHSDSQTLQISPIKAKPEDGQSQAILKPVMFSHASAKPVLQNQVDSTPVLQTQVNTLPVLQMGLNAKSVLQSQVNSIPVLQMQGNSLPVLRMCTNAKPVLQTQVNSLQTMPTLQNMKLVLQTQPNSYSVQTPTNLTQVLPIQANSQLFMKAQVLPTQANAKPVMQTLAKSEPLVQIPANLIPILQTQANAKLVLSAQADSNPVIPTEVNSKPVMQTQANSQPVVQTSTGFKPVVQTLVDTVSTSVKTTPSSDVAQLTLGGWLKVIIQGDGNEVSDSALEDQEIKLQSDILADIGNRQFGTNDMSSDDNSDKPYPCPLCHKRFSQESLIKTHFRAVHGGEVFFLCSVCDMKFGSSAALERHKATHDSQLQKCSTPKKTTVVSDPIVPKRKKQDSKLNSPTEKISPCLLKLECSVCGKVFTARHFLNQHRQRMHGLKPTPGNRSSGVKAEGPSKCSFCGKVFASQDFLAHHEKRVHKLQDAAQEESGNEVSTVSELEQEVHLEPWLLEFDDITDGTEVVTSECRENDIPTLDLQDSAGITDLQSDVMFENNAFECEQCGRGFNAELELESHMSEHGLTTGDTSEKVFANGQQLSPDKKDPKPSQVAKKGPFVCSVCKKIFTSHAVWRSHKRAHNKNQQHKCSECDATFKQKYPLLVHKKKVHGIDAHFECCECGVQCRSLSGLQTHRNVHRLTEKYKEYRKQYKYMEPLNDEDRRTKECEICQKTFSCHKNLRDHLRRHRGEKPYECTICQKAFVSMSDCRYHMRAHSDEKLYLCSVCGKQFKWKGSLRLHSHAHLTEKERTPRNRCKQCGVICSSKYHLMKHKRTHDGLKGPSCPQCGREFHLPSALRQHMLTHTGEKDFICEVCGRAFAQKAALKTHMRRHTGERPFACTMCAKAFVCSSSLRKHELIHTGVKPYHCEVCQKDFSTRSYWRDHLKIHRGEPAHQCVLCLKNFTAKGHLRRHLKDVHKYPNPQTLMDRYR